MNNTRYFSCDFSSFSWSSMVNRFSNIYIFIKKLFIIIINVWPLFFSYKQFIKLLIKNAILSVIFIIINFFFCKNRWFFQLVGFWLFRMVCDAQVISSMFGSKPLLLILDILKVEITYHGLRCWYESVLIDLNDYCPLVLLNKIYQ